MNEVSEAAEAAEAEQGPAVGVNRSVCKILSVILFSAIITLNIEAQRVPEIGLSLGTSQYMGDLNRSNLLYLPSFTGGVDFIYNLNTRMGFKTSLTYFTIKGNGFIDYVDNPFSFTNKFINYRLSYFVNYLEYDFGLNKYNFTPYFSLGLSFSRILQTNTEAEGKMSIPFGPGVKFLIKNKVSIGIEYLLNRSFTDAADGENINNFGDSLQDTLPDDVRNDAKSTFLNNKDWYSFLCLVITFKFINFADDCPAYD